VSLSSRRKTKVVDWRKEGEEEAEEKSLFFLSVLLIDIAKNKNRKKRIDVSLQPGVLHRTLKERSILRVKFFSSDACITCKSIES
jgi:hypothetical protein